MEVEGGWGGVGVEGMVTLTCLQLETVVIIEMNENLGLLSFIRCLKKLYASSRLPKELFDYYD